MSIDGKITVEMIDDLRKAVIAIDSDGLCAAFFSDLFTATETEQFAQRLRAAKLLLEGKTYAQIIAETDISSATLSRVSNCVRRGNGGYEKVIKKITEKD